MRLGEALLKKGVITAGDLSKALHAQMIYGGHLGTCLIEQGSINEATLGRALAEASGLEWAPPDRFFNIPPSVIETIPRQLAERQRVIPIARKNTMLDVALLDPRDLRVQDDLAFASGCKITPWIAPEVRIYQALERYYSVPQRQRYLTLVNQLDGQARDLEIVTVAQWSPAGSVPVSDAEDEAPEIVSLSQREQAVTELDTLSKAFCQAATEAQVVDAALDFATESLRRCIVFRVKACVAEVWSCRGIDGGLPPSAQTGFSVMSEPLFGLLLGNTHYRGGLPQEAKFLEFFDKLGISSPKEIIMVPIHVGDRLIALFYGDGGAEHRIAGDTETYRRLATKLGMALDMVRVQEKIRTL